MVTNLTATAALGFTPDLKQMSLKCKNVLYNPERKGIAGLRCTLKIKDQVKATALVYRTGKMVILGAKSKFQLDIAVEEFTAHITEKLEMTDHEC